MSFEIKDNVLIKYTQEPGVTEVVIPEGVTTIEESAFLRCKNLTSITIPNSVAYIGDGAFKYCENLTSITIPDSVTSIGDSVFYGCKNFTIHCNPNSRAEQYAKEHNISYEYLTNQPQDKPADPASKTSFFV